MAVGATTTNQGGAVQQAFGDEVFEQLENNNKLWVIGQKNFDKKPLNGKDIIEHLHSGRNSGISFRNEDELLEDAGAQEYTKATIPLRNAYASIAITGVVLKQMKRGESSVVDVKTAEMEGAANDLTRDFSRTLWGDGTGKLCSATSTTTGVTLNVNGVLIGRHPGQYINKIKIDVITGAGVVEVDGVVATLASFNEAANTAVLTLATSQSWTAASGIYRHGNKDREVTGMNLGNDDGTQSALYMGIDRTAAGNYWFKSNVRFNGGTPRNLSEAFFDDIYYDAYANADEDLPTHAFTQFKPFKTVAQTLVTQKQFITDERLKKMAGGHQGISLNGVDVMPDVDCNRGVLHLINANHVTFYQPEPMGWIDEFGGVWDRLEHKDKGYADMRWMINMFVDRPNVFGKLGDLQ